MPMVAIRECFFLAIGYVIAWSVAAGWQRPRTGQSYLYDAATNRIRLARAAMAGRSNFTHSWIRQTTRQLTMAVALIFLFLLRRQWAGSWAP